MSKTLPPIAQKALALAPQLVCGVLLLVIGMECARLFWLLMPEGPAWTPPPPSVTQAAPTPQRGMDIRGLLAANLYGEFNPEPAAVAELDPEDAPDTNLRLTLRGIVASDNEGESRALIESNPNDLMPYAVGMQIPGAARLHAIYADRVLLQRNGRLETLRLEKDRPTDPGAVVATNTPIQSTGGAPTVLDAQAAVKLSEIRTELLTDPSRASRYLRVQPARRDGGLVGYRIYPGRDRDLFREVGLRPGDIITSVNGIDLNDPARGLQLLGDLSQATSIDLTIERAGNLQSFSVTLNP